jgi:hypothetical protein
MKQSYDEGLATHSGPESCVAIRKGGNEAWTGGRAGRVFSRVRTLLRDADAVKGSGRPYPARRYREARRNPARSETPCTRGSIMRGNREVPGLPGRAVISGRSGKSSLDFQCAVKRRWSTAGKVPPGNWFAPPGSNRSSGGGNETAEASGVEGRVGDMASLQAVMKVNAVQAPKQAMQEPTRLESREGRSRWESTSEQSHRSCRGSGDGM